jgi:hypothetical protein
MSASLEKSMLDFVEKLQKDIKEMLIDVESRLVGGGVANMEHYKYLQGRRESLIMVQEAVKSRLNDTGDDWK